MKYVVDASIGFKWEVPESHSDKALRLRDDFLLQSHELLAPDLFPVEVANALMMAERRSRIPAGEAVTLLADLLTALPTIESSIPLLPRALEIATQAKASVYDCLYVALSERETCELVTADLKVVNGLQRDFPQIIELSTIP